MTSQPEFDAPQGGRRRLQPKAWMHAAWAALIVVSVAVTQLSSGAYQSELASHPDEAGHFVSAMCLLDYVRTALGRDPVAFAESYYVHYPKVALGHWPPAFFGIQALWYWILGASAPAGILLVGLIAVIAALVLFVRLRRFYGAWLAGLSLAVYLSLPVVRDSSSSLMPDMLAGLFGLLAVLAFCDGCVARTGRHWIASVLWGAMAILTKESALSLLVFAPAALILLGGETRRRLRTGWRVWVALSLLVVLVFAIYQFTGVLRLRSVPQVVSLALLWERPRYLLTFLRMVPWLVFATAALGGLSGTAIDRTANRMSAAYIRGAALWLFVWLVCQAIFRDVIEPRYFLPAVFPVIILFASGLDQLRRRVAAQARLLPISRWASPAAALVVPTTVAIVCLASMPAAVPAHRTGYEQMAASLPAVAVGPTILVSSDPSGEGAMVVECLLRDDARRRVVLRASKMLSGSDWMGGGYHLLTTSVPEVRDLLNAIPVQFIVLDASGFFDDRTRPHHRLLERTLTEESNQFRLVAELPLVLQDRRWDGGIRVYENLKARGRRPRSIRVPMYETLGRTLELQLDDQDALDARIGADRRRSRNVGASLRGVAHGIGTLLRNGSQGAGLFGIYPAHDSVGADGGPGVIAVAAETGRGWVVRTTAEWLSIKSGERGAGNGLVRYDVAQNDSNHERSGEVVIGEARYSVRQLASR